MDYEGKDVGGHYGLVIHTFEWLADDRGRVRLISADEGGDSRLRGTTMNREYDFSKGVRGKFFRPNAGLRLPIYLNADVKAYLAERAAEKGVPLGDMVNQLLKQEIRLIESVK